MGAIRVRPATPADARPIATVHVESWRSAYKHLMPEPYLSALSIDQYTSQWAASFERDPSRGRHLFVAEDEHTGIVAMALVGPDPEDRSRGLLFLMYVLESHWGTGAGHALMEASSADLRAAGFEQAILWVLEANDRARRFYERAGWRPDGTRQSDDYGGVELPALRYAITLPRREEATR